MTARCAPEQPLLHYYVVMQDYGRRGREAIVDPELTYRNVVERIASGEYKDILFIHRYEDGSFEDVTEAILSDAEDERQNAAERAWERHCEDFHDGGSTRFITLEQQQEAARRLK